MNLEQLYNENWKEFTSVDNLTDKTSMKFKRKNATILAEVLKDGRAYFETREGGKVVATTYVGIDRVSNT